MQKKVTLSADSEVYEQFRKHCESNAIMLSKRIELAMHDIMHSTEIPKVREVEKKVEKIRSWIG